VYNLLIKNEKNAKSNEFKEKEDSRL